MEYVFACCVNEEGDLYGRDRETERAEGVASRAYER